MNENGMMNGNGSWLFFILLIFLLGGNNGFGGSGSFSNEDIYSNQKLDGLAQCCCEQKLQCCENTNQLLRETINQGSMTRELINAQETARLRESLNECKIALSNQQQTNAILSQIGTFYPNPPCYPCQVNSGCGCGTSF